MTKVIGSISEQGWLTEPVKILNSVISYYILSDVGQSIVFQDNIINLPETYYKYINDPDGMSAGVRSDLDKLVSRYFEVIDIRVEVRQITEAEYGLLLSVAVLDADGNRLELNKIADISNSGLRRVIDTSNYGTGITTLQSL